MQTIDPDDVDEGDIVSIEYTAESAIERTRRTQDDLVVLEQMGQILKLETPWEETSDLRLVLDPEGDLWAREAGDSTSDRLFGSNGQVIA